MRKLYLTLLTILVLVGSVFIFQNTNTSADMEVDKDVRLVSVSGKGMVTASPDIAFIDIGVETEDKDAKVAQANNSKDMNKVMEALKKLGIKDKNIKTIRYSLYDRYEYNGKKEGKEKEKYYVVSNIVNVKIENIEMLGKVIDEVAKAGSNQISNIRFDISNKKDLYNQALELAMKDAHQKAAAIMQAFDEKPVKPYKIIESSYYAPFMRGDMNMIKGMDTRVNPGELEITASLMVEYDY